MAVVTLKSLLESGVHFGHQTKRWDPKMKKYIFSQRNGIHIIDLQKTIGAVKIAYDVIRDAVVNQRSILFVGTKKQAQQAVEREAKRCGMHYVTNRWLGGMLTNFATIKRSLQRLKRIEKMEVDGTFENLTKKEIARLNKERSRLERNLGGIKEMADLPGIVFVVDTRKEAIAVTEAKRMGIPIVGIVDTNCNPDVIDFPVPGNDDAIRAINLFTQIMANAVIDAENEVGLEVIETLQDEDLGLTGDDGDEEGDTDFASVMEHTEVIDKDRYNPDDDVETVSLAETVAAKAEDEQAEEPEADGGFTDQDYSDFTPDEKEDAEPEATRTVADDQGIDEDKEDKLYEAT